MESHGWGDSHSHRCEVKKNETPHPLCVCVWVCACVHERERPRTFMYFCLSLCVSIPLSVSFYVYVCLCTWRTPSVGCACFKPEFLVSRPTVSCWGLRPSRSHTHHFVCAYRKLFLMLTEIFFFELMLYNMPFPIKLAVFSPYKFLQSFWHAFCKVLGQLVVSSLSCACRKSPDSPPPPSNIFHWNLSWMKIFQKRKMVLENCLKFCVFSSWNQLVLWGFVFVVGLLTNCGGYS